MAPKPKPWKPDAYKPEQEEQKDTEWLDKKDEGELAELDDEFQDDRALEEYRRRRIQELQAAAAKPRFGTVEEISSNEFIEKVTNTSEKAWVVCFLYKASHAGCVLLRECLVELARKYHGTRFVSIVSTSCIPNYPDQNLPTLLLYHNRSVVKHLVGLAQFGGARATPEQVALVLNGYGPVCVSGDGDAAAEAAAAQEQVRGLLERMVQQREREEQDESSDFDD
ncbi:hypothetical protein OEZ85_001809 [Tetradesmus obliquus]|uniref:Phosducin domain-containing protein n=1 Tax=Tetradesmus obliquus TaxID=3088 RepID=A0ABY8U159_TETOB|nr:hypothetical protein OEZ85_001809 [Tetradesmus obliquus]